MPETRLSLAALFSNLEYARAKEKRLVSALKVASDNVSILDRAVNAEMEAGMVVENARFPGTNLLSTA